MVRTEGQQEAEGVSDRIVPQDKESEQMTTRFECVLL
jgi:hypothetical protein